MFEGSPCAGDISDVKPGNENFTIITDGNNRFDENVYRAPKSAGPARFAWGHTVMDWNELRAMGMERNGRLILY
jgi:hypothetical protein